MVVLPRELTESAPFTSILHVIVLEGFTVVGVCSSLLCFKLIAMQPLMFFTYFSDTEPPEFTSGCPSNIQAYAAAVGQKTLVTWTPPVVTDSSGQDVQLWSDVPPGASFPLGVSLVTYTANDTSGNENSCNFSVTVTGKTLVQMHTKSEKERFLIRQYKTMQIVKGSPFF